MNRITALTMAVLILVSGALSLGNPTDGVVGYWSFDDPSDPGHDDSGNGQDGTLHGATWTSEGCVGGALEFDGDHDYVYIPDHPSQSGMTELTLEAWIYPTDFNPKGKPICIEIDIINKWGPVVYPDDSYLLSLQDGQPHFSICDGTYEGSIGLETDPVPLNEWTHIMGVYDGLKCYLYINGSLAAVSDKEVEGIVIQDTSMPIKIGSGDTASCAWDNTFCGKIDEVGIYDYAVAEPALLVEIDIKPGSCPNPLNVKTKGLLPLAILGSEEFDVTTIDAASIRLAGVSPIRSSYEDVAAPVSDGADECECTTEGPDGYLDLTLKFKIQDIVDALGEVNDGDEIILTISGKLSDGRDFAGADCVVIIKKGSNKE